MSDEIHIILADEEKRVLCRPGMSLAQLLFLEGFWAGRPLCAGLGRCGLCRTRFLSPPPPLTAAEERVLSSEEAGAGVRLACQHEAAAGWRVEVRADRRPLASRPRRGRSSADQALALDVGATSLHWALLARAGGAWRRSAAGAEPNPQLGAGGDVISRLAFAARPGGRERLRDVIVERITDLAAQAGGVESLAVAGNPTMIHLLLDLDLTGLSRAPYRLAFAGGEWRRLATGLPDAYIPPLLAPFVGADISAGLAALFFGPSRTSLAFPFLLADLGTNGEFVLALSAREFLVASAPMGPALEGMGLSRGAVAGDDAVTAFDIDPAGLRPRFHDPDRCGWPSRLSGTGYLSLLAQLRRLGRLGQDGAFLAPTTPLAAKAAAGPVADRGEPRLLLPTALDLPASDVEEVLKVKAAFNAVWSALLTEAGLGFENLAAIHLAGALGEHVRPADLETLGFLPPGGAALVLTAGNTSLAGAELSLTDEAVRPWLAELPSRVRLVELTDRTTFMHDYLRRMTFSHVA